MDSSDKFILCLIGISCLVSIVSLIVSAFQ